MINNTAIRVEGISKKFCRSIKHTMLYGALDLSRSFLGLDQHTERLRDGEFWAVNDVSFELKKGEVIGLIGSNGSGKSTILKMLNGIFMPDKGKIGINGRVGALIELGAGFHPMLTGRENIYINAAVLGINKKHIDTQIDKIIEFSGIGEFIDTPVKFYSSGMYARLGFSIAAHMNPDILLIDEVLAVGDMEFREKAMRHMDSLRSSNKAVVFVTHSLYQVEALCNRAIWLEKGRLKAIGPAKEIVGEYLNSQEEKIHMSSVQSISDTKNAKTSDELLEILKVELLDEKGQCSTTFPFGSSLTVRLHYSAKRPIHRPLFNLRILNGGRGVVEAGMLIDGFGPEYIEGSGVVECKFDHLPLTPKTYEILLFIRSSEGTVDITEMRICAHFRITDENTDTIPLRGPMAINHFRAGVFYVGRTWSFYDDSGKQTASISSYQKGRSVQLEAGMKGGEIV